MQEVMRSFETTADDIADAMFWAEFADDFDAPPADYSAAAFTFDPYVG